jgi:hypothetical protein
VKLVKIKKNKKNMEVYGDKKNKVVNFTEKKEKEQNKGGEVLLRQKKKCSQKQDGEILEEKRQKKKTLQGGDVK